MRYCATSGQQSLLTPGRPHWWRHLSEVGLTDAGFRTVIDRQLITTLSRHLCYKLLSSLVQVVAANAIIHLSLPDATCQVRAICRRLASAAFPLQAQVPLRLRKRCFVAHVLLSDGFQEGKHLRGEWPGEEHFVRVNDLEITQ